MLRDYSMEPKRPLSHQIGDNAQDQVRELFTSQGWVVNSIVSDYGDDLHVQLTEGSALIPVRMYIQVKGTDDMEKSVNGDVYKISNLKKTTVSHWLNSVEPTVLVLWDVKKKFGIYGFAEEIFHDFDPDKKIKNLSAILSKRNTLDAKSIKSFKIDAISYTCNKKYLSLLGVRSFINVNEEEAQFYGMNKKVVNSEMGNAIILYLTSLGILKKDKKGQFGLNAKFHKYFHNTLADNLQNIHWESVDLEKEFEKIFGRSVVLALIGWRQNKFQHGSQSGLIDGAAKVIETYYEDRKKLIYDLLDNVSVND